MAVEAQACGTPVIALGRGGASETVIDAGNAGTRTGVFFPRQTVEDIVRAVCRFEDSGWFDPAVCRENALRFTPERFRREFLAVVRQAMAGQAGRPRPAPPEPKPPAPAEPFHTDDLAVVPR